MNSQRQNRAIRRMLRRAVRRHERQKIVAYIHANFRPMTAEQVALSQIFKVVAQIERERRMAALLTIGTVIICASYFWGQSLVDYIVVSALH